MSDQKNTIVGIDLGTTYSCIAAIDELGNPVIGKNRNGDSTTPSVVHFVIGRDTKDCEVGQVAKDSAITEPDRTAQLFKPLMGKPGVNVDDVRLFYEELKGMDNELPNAQIDTLSMGMSGDYELAIKHGSTLVRIGSGLFGARNYNV